MVPMAAPRKTKWTFSTTPHSAPGTGAAGACGETVRGQGSATGGCRVDRLRDVQVVTVPGAHRDSAGGASAGGAAGATSARTSGEASETSGPVWDGGSRGALSGGCGVVASSGTSSAASSGTSS